MADFLMANAETFAFGAEINMLLSLNFDTFYNKKEMFLRELIRNSSDALHKLRFKMLTDNRVKGDAIAQSEFFIRIVPDKVNKTLSIIDCGIGMTKADLVDMGTIAGYGTKEFVKAFQTEANIHEADMSMIGKFGVGFYSAYLVAEKVIVTTKHNDDEQYVWKSQAGGSFTVTRDVNEEQLGWGTKITLYLKEDQLEYLEESRIKDLVKEHSEFISYQIYLWTTKKTETEIGDDEEDEPKKEEEGTIEKVAEEDKVKKKIQEVSQEWQLINEDKKPIWLRKPEEIPDYEYASFYKSLTNDWEDHLAVKHFSFEGRLNFKAILFVQKRNHIDLFDIKNWRNIKLIVRESVFMTFKDNCEDLLPGYLGFVKGVVCCDDLPLNIGSGMLKFKLMRKLLVKKCIEMFNEIAENKEDYTKFYRAFSTNLKVGILRDNHNRAKLAHLLRYYSSRSIENVISLKEYLRRMEEGEKEIFYSESFRRNANESLDSWILGLCHTERKIRFCPTLLRCKMGTEVLFLEDEIDHNVFRTLRKYEGKKLFFIERDIHASYISKYNYPRFW